MIMKKIYLISVVTIILLFCLVPAGFSLAGILDFFYQSRDVLLVSENKVLLDNQEIKLRGVGVNNPLYRQYDGRTDDDYRIISEDWKANFVRLSVHPGEYKRNQRNMERTLKDQVEIARKNGLFVIVEWHVVGMPDGWYRPPYDNNPNKRDIFDSNYRLAQEFWKYASVQFRGDRGVVFELWNEPQTENSDLKWSDIKPYLEGFYGIIRSQGAQNIVLASGPHWTYDLRGIKNDPLMGDNIAYAWHVYPNNYRHMDWETALDGLNEKYPVFLTEWGFSMEDEHKNEHFYHQGWHGFPTDIKKYILEKDLHFTAWCWHAVAGPNMLKRNWKDLTDFGGYTKDFLNNFDEIENVRKKINSYLKYGVDYNTAKLGEGERRAVVYSFNSAFGRYPESEWDYEDVIKIASGRWPGQRSTRAEERAKNSFRYIYKREPNMNNQNDNAAVTVMAYGLRQRAENRNLNSERQGIAIFRSIYRRLPSSTEDWNIMQAITYSGARR